MNPLSEENVQQLLDTNHSFTKGMQFLSNMYPCPVYYRGCCYNSVEHAYQAAKAINANDHDLISACNTSYEAKKMGRVINCRKDWDEVKDAVMLECVSSKFMTSPDLAYKLLQTENHTLVEYNYWGDTYWGVSRGTGENKFGLILMHVRQGLKLCLKN